MGSQDYFEHLVENALDFLRRSIEDFDTAPKYSVVHFNTAMELFLKSRLMAEHWSLVVSKGEELDWSRFSSGDFRSVTIKDAMKRLQSAVRAPVPEMLESGLISLSKHRNRMVHFYHEAHTEKSEHQQRAAIAKEQLRVWHGIHSLLVNDWLEVFRPWMEEIAEIESLFKKQRAYLGLIYEHAKPKIETAGRLGKSFGPCPACQFEALERVVQTGVPFSTECRVCGLHETTVTIECDCGGSVRFANEGFAQCQSCGRQYEPEHLSDALVDPVAAYRAIKDGDESFEPGNCAECDGYHTVIRTSDADYFCTSCFERFDYLSQCQWCGEPNTGDVKFSGIQGCSHCDGSSNYE